LTFRHTANALSPSRTIRSSFFTVLESFRLRLPGKAAWRTRPREIPAA
jgi:hypothetical protein